jgi:uncharacterized delta-60 repeat protein
MKRTALVSLALSTLLLGAAHAHAAAGDLDRSFGKNGKALRDVGGTDLVVDVAAQRDRKTLALVEIERGRNNSVAVMRLLRNGRLDRDFAGNGIAKVSIAGDERAGGLELQPNGKIVVSFTSDPSEADSSFGVARFKANGAADGSLDGDGVQTAGFGTGFSSATANDVALDGTDIVAVGSVFNGADTFNDFAVARFDSNGELDSSFAGDGRQTTDFNEESDVAVGVDVDSAGRVVAVGTANPPGNVDPLAIARYDSNGELDSSFSEDGRLISMLAPEGHDVVTLADGRIAVAGTVSGDLLAARFTEGGDPDETFSDDGAETIDFVDGADAASAIALSGSKLVVVGTARTPLRGRDYGIARLTAAGEPDASFSEDGRRAVDLAKDEDNALGVAVDRTGDVVVGGGVRRGTTDTGILRLNGKGGRS